MTREAEIRQTAAEWLRYNHPTCTQDMLVEAFRCGAEWADKHQPNPWISIEERLPDNENNPDEYNAPHRARSSRNVIITDGVIVNRGYYSYARMRWEWNEGEIKVTHWMPIPKLSL